MELLCPECRAVLDIGANNAVSTAVCTTHGATFEVLFDRHREARQQAAAAAASSPGPMCAQHTAVASVARCRVCGNGVCAICDFALPGGIHVCPSCIETRNDDEISPARKRNAWIAIGFAALTTIVVVLMVSGAVHRAFGVTEDNEAVNTVTGNLMLWPAIAGMGFAFASFDRRLRKTPVMWIAVIWNCVLIALFLLFLVVGLTMG